MTSHQDLQELQRLAASALKGELHWLFACKSIYGRMFDMRDAESYPFFAWLDDATEHIPIGPPARHLAWERVFALRKEVLEIEAEIMADGSYEAALRGVIAYCRRGLENTQP